MEAILDTGMRCSATARRLPEWSDFSAWETGGVKWEALAATPWLGARWDCLGAARISEAVA